MTIALVGLLVVSVFVAVGSAYLRGQERGYDEAWKDIARAYRRAEADRHGWPDPEGKLNE